MRKVSRRIVFYAQYRHNQTTIQVDKPLKCGCNIAVNLNYLRDRLTMRGGFRPNGGRPKLDINAFSSTEYMPSTDSTESRSNSERERKTPLEYLVDLYNDPT